MSNNKYKILVVEDDRNILSMIQTVLDTNGYQVLTAQRCQQGILMLSSHIPDLVVLDLGLPDMDGEEFIRIARRNSMIPIIVLSARTDEKDKVSALEKESMSLWESLPFHYYSDLVSVLKLQQSFYLSEPEQLKSSRYCPLMKLIRCALPFGSFRSDLLFPEKLHVLRFQVR